MSRPSRRSPSRTVFAVVRLGSWHLPYAWRRARNRAGPRAWRRARRRIYGIRRVHGVGAGRRHKKRRPLDRLHTRDVERLGRCAVEKVLYELLTARRTDHAVACPGRRDVTPVLERLDDRLTPRRRCHRTDVAREDERWYV